MYWTDHQANNNTISEADMDGTNIEIIISDGLTFPRGLAVDDTGNCVIGNS
jgi:hypothetical protein